MTEIYGGLVLVAIMAGIIFIALQPRPVRRGRGSDSGGDSPPQVGGSSHGNDSGSGFDGGSSGGGDGGGGGGGD